MNNSNLYIVKVVSSLYLISFLILVFYVLCQLWIRFILTKRIQTSSKRENKAKQLLFSYILVVICFVSVFPVYLTKFCFEYLGQPGSDWATRRADYERNRKQNTLDIQRKAANSAREQNIRNEFFEKTEPKMLRSYNEMLARAGMQAVERDFKRRQEALKQVLIQDELRWKCMEDELTAQEQSDRFAEAKIYTENLRAQEEARRQEMVKKKRDQQDRLRFDELRKLQSLKMTEDCKAVNLGQMRDKRDQQEADREVNRMFSDLNNKLLAAQNNREVYDARRRLALTVQQQEALKAQIAYKNQMTERKRSQELCFESERIRLLQEDLSKDKKKELEDKHRKQQTIRGDFEAQINLRRRIMAEEADIEAVTTEHLNREYKSQISDDCEKQHRNKNYARLESMMFLNYADVIKQDKLEREKREDKLIEEERIKMQRQADERRCKELEARKQLLKQTMQEREKQLKEREEMRRFEEQLAKSESAEMERLRQCQLELREEYNKRKQEEKLMYASDLNSQLAYQGVLKRREEEEDKRYALHCKEEDENYVRRLKELLNKAPQDFIHPFKLKIDQGIASNRLQ